MPRSTATTQITGAEALAFHARGKPGKLEIQATKPLTTAHDLSPAYSPGVAAPCLEIRKTPEVSYDYTSRGNIVAVISNGTAVLGLGNLGALASKPVMEGKAVLFKRFADIDGIDLEVDTEDVDEFIDCVRFLGKSWGGINLEDISAPRCFEVERRLHESLDIPVMHDDQHGTAVVALAGVINALKLTNREPKNTRTVILGAGASGIACGALLREYGCEDVALIDSKGLLTVDREDLNPYKRVAAEWCGYRNKEDGGIPQTADAIRGADLFLGLSGPGLVSTAEIASMNADSMVFAMANPTPEIMPDEAAEAGAAIIATGRSDFPNQINNALGFPGLFRGLLDGGIPRVHDGHKIAAAQAIADFVGEPTPDRIVPSIFENGLAQAVAKSVIAVG